MNDWTTHNAIATPTVSESGASLTGELPKDNVSSAAEGLAGPPLKDLASSFRLLADETRLRVLSLLVEFDELHVRALCELLGQSQPAVSHHLGLLRSAGLVRARRDGKHNFYSTVPEKLESVIELARSNVMPRNGLA